MSSDSNEIRVSIESMPRSLAFMSRGAASGAADALNSFLAVATGCIAQVGQSSDRGPIGDQSWEDWPYGQEMAFALLRDLMDIASGRSAMPLTGAYDDEELPTLGDVLKAGHDALKANSCRGQGGERGGAHG